MLQKYDCITGISTGYTSKGTFVEFGNGESGWISKAFLPEGTKVICTILYVKENGFPIMLLDSAEYQAA